MNRLDKDQITKTLRNSISELDEEPPVKMYLISRNTTKGKDSSYNVYTVDIEGEIPKYFREIIRNKFNEFLKDEELTYKEFFDLNYSAKEIRTLPVTYVEAFKSISNGIEHFADLDIFEGMNKIKNIWAYCIEIKFKGDKLIYFRKYAPSKIISKNKVAATFFKKKLNKVDGEVLVFDDSIDCVYYKSLGFLIIPDAEKFENIFNFNEFYRRRSESTLKSLLKSDLIDVDPGIISDASMNARISQRITELSERGMLETVRIQKLISSKYFQKHKKELPNIITYHVVNGKIKIDNVDSLFAFIDSCAENYLKGLASDNKYRAEYKELL